MSKESDGSTASSAALSPDKSSPKLRGRRGIIDTATSNVLEILEEQERASPSRREIPNRSPTPRSFSPSRVAGLTIAMRKLTYQRQDSADSHNSIETFGSGTGDNTSGGGRDNDEMLAENDVTPYDVKEGVEAHYTTVMNEATRRYVSNQVLSCRTCDELWIIVTYEVSSI